MTHTQLNPSSTKDVFVEIIFLGKNQHSVSQVHTHYFAVQWASVAVVSLDNNHHFKWGGKNTEWPRVEEDKQANHTAPSLLTQSAVVCRSQDWYLHQAVCIRDARIRSPASPTYPEVALIVLMQMTQWHRKMGDGAEFWISCYRLTFLIILTPWKFIENLVPSTILGQ